MKKMFDEQAAQAVEAEKKRAEERAEAVKREEAHRAAQMGILSRLAQSIKTRGCHVKVKKRV